MIMEKFSEILTRFKSHYQDRLGASEYQKISLPGIDHAYCLENSLLKAGNGPRLFLHDSPTDEVIVLTHGLSDSPYYMQAVACRFYAAGCQVVMPLLPAHGLIDPDRAMEDDQLDQKWKATIDHAVETAAMLGKRVSIGGFSTGGALSLNRVLREEAITNGGLFLFSAALSIGGLAETAGRLNFIQSITRITDGKIAGVGRDPYKYPMLPSFAGFELVQIINENRAMSEEKGREKLSLPVYAAHSFHDTTAELKGILSFMENHVKKGVTMIVSSGVSHSSLPLDCPVALNLREALGPANPPAANPMFDWMMEGALRFFEKEIKKKD